MPVAGMALTYSCSATFACDSAYAHGAAGKNGRSWLVWILAAPLLAAFGCSVVGVTGRPDTVEAGTTLRCTDSYWLPAAEATVIALLVPTSIWLSHEARERVDAAHDRGEFDAQDGIAPLVPYLFAALIGAPLAVSATYGSVKIFDCREAMAWVAKTQVPPHAGHAGQDCVPVLDGLDRCLPGFYCREERCEPISIANRTPTVSLTWHECAVQQGALNAPMSREEWIKRWNLLPESCRARLRNSCAASIAELQSEVDEHRRAQLRTAMRPACLSLLAIDRRH